VFKNQQQILSFTISNPFRVFFFPKTKKFHLHKAKKKGKNYKNKQINIHTKTGEVVNYF